MEENRNMKRLLSIQETELNRFTRTESDLPVIMRAHNEETRVLKMKIKQIQATNKKIHQSVKSKDTQILSLMEENKHLRKINGLEKKDEIHVLQERLADITTLLDSRDKEFKVQYFKRILLEFYIF